MDVLKAPFTLYVLGAALLIVTITESVLSILGKPNQLGDILQFIIGGSLFGVGAHTGATTSQAATNSTSDKTGVG